MKRIIILIFLSLLIISGCKDKMTFYPTKYDGKHLRTDDGYYFTYIYGYHIDVTKFMIFYRNGIVRQITVDGIIPNNLLDETFAQHVSIEPNSINIVAFKINPPLIVFSGRKKWLTDYTVKDSEAAILNDTIFCRPNPPSVDTFRFRLYKPKPDSLSCLKWIQY